MSALRYLVGDTREIVAGIPDGSVALLATSPPFLALRSYLPAGHDAKHAEIGSEATPAAFLDTLLALTAEWGRVLAPWGSIAVELGDTYAGSGGAGGDYAEGGLRAGQNAFSGSMKYERNGRRAPGGQPYADMFGKKSPGGAGWPLAKSLALIPELYAVALAYGINPLTGQPSPAGRWRVRNVVTWHRPNPAVGALGDKVRPSTSYITIATRSAKRWFDLDAVRTPGTEPGAVKHKLRNYSAANPSTGWTADNEFIHQNPAGAPPLDCWFDEYDGTHDTWTLTTQPSRLSHFAMWPAKLAERLVLMMCPAEVCAICGEPRRRCVDRQPSPYAFTYHPGQNGGSGTGGMGGHTAVRNAPTIGWTDCGCRCTCWACAGGLGECLARWKPGVVLDPFAGTGTTGLAAEYHGRDAICIDVDERNRDLVPKRRAEVRRALAPNAPVEIVGQTSLFGESA